MSNLFYKKDVITVIFKRFLNVKLQGQILVFVNYALYMTVSTGVEGLMNIVVTFRFHYIGLLLRRHLTMALMILTMIITIHILRL